MKGMKMTPAQNIVVPELDYPFPPVINEHADAVHRGTVEWVRRFDLLPNERAYRFFAASGLGYLVARNHPESEPSDLQLMSDWYAWLFLRDDKGDASAVGRQPERLSAADNRLLDILEGANADESDEPLAHALLDLRVRLQEYLYRYDLTDVWMRRLVRAVREHLEATLWEAANRARATVPDIESYIRMRPLTGGLSIVTELIEIIEGYHLPAEVREHAAVRRLSGASHNIACWANDIISLAKELRCGEVNNLVVVLSNEFDLTLQEAVDRAARMHDAEVQVFVQTAAQLPSFGPAVDEILARYVSVLQARMRGILDWSYQSERYRITEEASKAPVGELTIALPRR